MPSVHQWTVPAQPMSCSEAYLSEWSCQLQRACIRLNGNKARLGNLARKQITGRRDRLLSGKC